MPPSLSRSRRPGGLRIGRRVSLAGLAVSSLLGVAPARAEDAPPAPAASARDVGEVSVTATRAERSLLDTAGNVTVITREDIERSGVVDLPELLRREAGLYVTNTTSNPAGYNVEARGFNNGGGNGASTLVLVDGRRANETQNRIADWALLHVDDVERVEIVRGPASAVYGDNAVGGVINIVTRRPEGPNDAELRGRAGTHGLWESSLFARGGRGPVSATFFADRGATDGSFGDASLRQQAYRFGLQTEMGERITAGVQMGYSSGRRQLPGAESVSLIGPEPVPGPATFNGDDVRARFVTGSFEATPIDDLLLTITPYARARHDSGLSSQADSFEFSTRNDSDATGVDAQLQLDTPLLGLRNRLVAGTDWSREDADIDSVFSSSFLDSTTTNHNRRRSIAGYLQDEISLTEKLLLAGGVRYDKARYRLAQTTDGFASDTAYPTHAIWAPRASLTYRVLDPLSVYAGYSRGFRFPTLEETAQFAFFSGNPALVPQTSASYETGVKWRSARVRGDLALYWMNVHDEILFDPLAGFGQNVNLDRTRHRGVEAALGGQPATWLDLSASFTYDDATIRRDTVTGLDGKRVPITPVYRWNGNATLLLPFGFEPGLNVYWVGQRSFGNDLQNAFPQLPKYARYDFVLRWHPKPSEWSSALAWGGIDFTFAIRNLTNRRYEEVGSLSAFTPGLVGIYPAPGRIYELALTLAVKP